MGLSLLLGMRIVGNEGRGVQEQLYAAALGAVTSFDWQAEASATGSMLQLSVQSSALTGRLTCLRLGVYAASFSAQS